MHSQPQRRVAAATICSGCRGGPNHYDGLGLRQAHAHLVSRGLEDTVFDAFLLHFQDVLRELGVSTTKIVEIMPLFYGTRSAVLNR